MTSGLAALMLILKSGMTMWLDKLVDFALNPWEDAKTKERRRNARNLPRRASAPRRRWLKSARNLVGFANCRFFDNGPHHI